MWVRAAMLFSILGLALPAFAAPISVTESAFGPGATVIDFERPNNQVITGLVIPGISVSGGLYGSTSLEPTTPDLSANGTNSAANFANNSCVILTPSCGTVRIDFDTTQQRVGFYVMTGALLGTTPDDVTIETFTGDVSNGSVVGHANEAWSFIGVEDSAGIDRIDISAASVKSRFHMDFLTFQVPEPSLAALLGVSLGALVLRRRRS